MELLDEKDLEQATGGSDIVDGKVLVDGENKICLKHPGFSGCFF